MFKIAICDDEIHFRNEIKEILKNYLTYKGIIYEIDTFRSGKEFIDLGIEIIKYKIVFLDINMDEMDGIKTAKSIRQVSNEVFIAFITAYVNYAFEGYKVDAVRYILKNNINFVESVHECIDAINIKMNYVIERKTLNFNEGRKNISLEHLLYIESKLHKLEFYIMEDSLNKYTLYGTLNELEKEFVGSCFIRIHQSYLVNMKHIKKVSRYMVLLSNGIQLDIPRARYKYVEETFVAYKGEI